MELEDQLGQMIRELRSQDRMRLPGLQQLDHLVRALQEDNEEVSLPEMINSLEVEGRRSPYYAQSQTILNNMRRDGLTEKLLHKDHMGRS